MKLIFKKYSFDKNIIKQFNKLNKDLSNLKKIIHKLDELSYAFRYPVKNDSKMPNFPSLSDIKTRRLLSANINFKEVKEMYEKSMILLLYSTDVIADVIN